MPLFMVLKTLVFIQNLKEKVQVHLGGKKINLVFLKVDLLLLSDLQVCKQPLTEKC